MKHAGSAFACIGDCLPRTFTGVVFTNMSDGLELPQALSQVKTAARAFALCCCVSVGKQPSVCLLEIPFSWGN